MLAALGEVLLAVAAIGVGAVLCLVAVAGLHRLERWLERDKVMEFDGVDDRMSDPRGRVSKTDQLEDS